MSNKYVLGIDLGTSNSVVTIWKDQKPHVITDYTCGEIIPSVVAFSNCTKYVGHEANNQKEINPLNVFYDIKRLIGRKFSSEEVSMERDFLTYDIYPDENDNILLKTHLRNELILKPEIISAFVLNKLKLMAKNYIENMFEDEDVGNVFDAIITIPAKFNDSQRQATKDAAQIAGLNVLTLINEPTAAALAYGVMKVSLDTDNILKYIVYDFGGGTLDVSLLEVYNGTFEVKASCGNSHFGGSDFDIKIMNFCINNFKKTNDIVFDNLDICDMSLYKLRVECESAKKKLSVSTYVNIKVSNFYQDIDLNIDLTRELFLKICNELFLYCIKPINDVLEMTNNKIESINDIILVGGMTRMPHIRHLIKHRFGKEPNCTTNPDTAISIGAAIQGYLVNNIDDPFAQKIALLDVTSMSIGVETSGGIMDVIIKRNELIPCSKSKFYTTDKDNVESVMIKIYEGERGSVTDNFFVGEFELKGLEPKKRGLNRIEVNFKVSADGIVSVTATDLFSEKTNNMIVITNKGRLSQEEINKLVKEAKKYEKLDEVENFKKKSSFYLNDNILTVYENIMSKDNIIEESVKQKLLEELEKFKKTNMFELDVESIKQVQNKFKQIFFTFIRDKNLSSNVKEFSTNSQKFTSIFDESINDKQNSSQHEKNAIIDEQFKQKREEVANLCTALNYAIVALEQDPNVDLERLNVLRDYVDDCALWVHITSEKNEDEFNFRINKMNEMSNIIVSQLTKSD